MSVPHKGKHGNLEIHYRPIISLKDFLYIQVSDLLGSSASACQILNDISG